MKTLVVINNDWSDGLKGVLLDHGFDSHEKAVRAIISELERWSKENRDKVKEIIGFSASWLTWEMCATILAHPECPKVWSVNSIAFPDMSIVVINPMEY